MKRPWLLDSRRVSCFRALAAVRLAFIYGSDANRVSNLKSVPAHDAANQSIKTVPMPIKTQMDPIRIDGRWLRFWHALLDLQGLFRVFAPHRPDGVGPASEPLQISQFQISQLRVPPCCFVLPL